MRRKFTIPAAGVTVPIPMTGRSVLIESVNLYLKPEHVPVIGFNSGDNQNPIYPQSSYEYDQGKFNNLTITGTDESEGDEVWIITVNDCLGNVIRIQHRDAYSSEPGSTFTKGATNAVQDLSELELVNDEGDLPKTVYVSSTGGNIRYCFEEDPNQADPGNAHVLLEDAIPFEIIDISWILAFKFIAEIEDETPNLVVTCEY